MDQYFSGKIQYRILKYNGVFGVNSNVLNNLCFTPNFDFTQTEYTNYNVITYVCGNTIVFKNFNTGIDRVESIGGTEIFGITNLYYITEEKLLCICFKGKNDPFINFYDVTSRPLRKRVQIKEKDLGSDHFICVDKGLDGEYFIALTGEPDYSLFCWVFDGVKSKLLCSTLATSKEKEPVNQCSLSPNSRFICVTGNGVFKLFEILRKEKKLNLIKNSLRENKRKENLLCHKWLENNKIIIINDLGNIFMVENNSLVCKLQYSPDDQLNLYNIVKTENGFVCGGEKGIVHVFERSNKESIYFKRKKVLKVESESNENTICKLAYDETSKILVALTKMGELHKIKLEGRVLTEKTTTSTIPEKNQLFSQKKEITVGEEDEYLSNFECLMSFHNGGITSVDTCIQKPYCVTSGLDKTIRILDYHTNVIVTKKFKNECLCVSIHPTGFYLLIGFADNLKFYKVLGNQLLEHTSFPVRNCSKVKFCSGGHLFAAVYGTVINIYSTNYLTHVHTLRGHNGRIKSIFWKNQDTRITSADINGTVIEFQISNEKKIDENSAAKTSFSGVVSTKDLIYASGSDGNIHVFLKGIPHENCSTGAYPPTALALSEKLNQLFVGLEDGSICIYDISQEELDDYDDKFFVHSSKVVELVLSFDDNLLFSVSSDGSLSIFDVKNRKQQKIIKTAKFSNEILISKLNLEEKDNVINQLKAKYRELKADNDYDRKKKEMEFSHKIKEQKRKFELELKERDHNISHLENEIQNKNRQFIQELKDDEIQFKKDVEDLDKGLQQQITSTMNQLKQLTISKEKDIESLKVKTSSLTKKYSVNVEKIKIEFVDLDKKKKTEIRKLKEDAEEEEKIHVETIKQTKEDHETLVEKITFNYEDLLKKARDQNLKLSGENTIKENNEKEHEKLIKNLENEKEELTNKLKKEEMKLKKKNEEIKSVMSENTERENTIVEKEKKIFELKKQNQELEKYKFVLDHKINSLTEQIKPTKDQITRMRKEMKKKGIQLENFKASNEQLLESIKVLENTIVTKNKRIKRFRKRNRDTIIYRERVKSEIFEVIQNIQYPGKLKLSVQNFYDKHARSSSIQKLTLIDPEVKAEAERQKKYLELTIDSLKKKLIKTTNTAKRENMKIMQENIMLINEINVLRNEARNQKRELRETDDRLMMNKEQQIIEEDKLIIEENKKKLQTVTRQVELNKIEIESIRQRIKKLELEKKQRQRPISKGQLPPIV